MKKEYSIHIWGYGYKNKDSKNMDNKNIDK